MLEAALIAGRTLQFAAAVVLLGSPLFQLYGVSRATVAHEGPAAPIRQIVLVAAFVALIAATILLMTQTAEMTGSANDAFNLEMIWIVASDTHFGAVWSLRIGLIAAAILAAVWPRAGHANWITQTLIGVVLISSLALTGHGGAGEGAGSAIHLAADIVHLIAAGVWLGALPPLAILLSRAAHSKCEGDARAALFGLSRFSSIGPVVVAALVLSGVLNSWFLIGPPYVVGALFQPYGQVLAIKLALVAAMLGLAAWNRWRLTPRLRYEVAANGGSARALHLLRRSVATETALGALVLGAVAVLGTLSPPMEGG